MTRRRHYSWIYDFSGSIGYNITCAVEISLAKLGCINFDPFNQWHMEEVENFDIKYGDLRDE